MKATTKKELVEKAVNKIINIEEVKWLTASLKLVDWTKIEMTFYPRKSKNYPTKKEKIIKECMSFIRNRRYDENEPSIFRHNFDLENIQSLSFKNIEYLK